MAALLISRTCHAERPNILFIYADDQNYKTLSCYPESPDWINTPNIDALAREGVRFERCYFGAWCMPSRASFLTGRLQHGVQTMRMEGTYPASTYDPQQCRFWPATFRENGYHTAQIGKWHTGVDTGNGRDWDHQIVWNRPGHPDNAGNYFANQIVTFNGVDREVDGYSTDNYTDWAIDYINGEHRDADKPWYLWLCYGAVHGPTTPAERHEGKLAGHEAELPADIFGPWPDKPQYLSNTSAWVKGDDGKAYRRKKQVRSSNFNTNTAGQSYDDWVQQTNECAMAIDEGVGRLIETLRKTGQLENTLVVYTADQGFALGEHGFNQKIAAYDATIASPMIIRHPQTIPQGKVCRHPVSAPDVVQLFCDVADVTVPWKMHGRDIRPLLKDPESQDWSMPVLMTHTGRKYGDDTVPIPNPSDEAMTIVGDVPWYALLRDGKYKYIRTFVEGEVEEVYDLHSDPEELVNLAVKPENKALLERLRALAIKELRRTDAKLVDSMPHTAAMLAQAKSASDEAFVSLFDGTTLDGWRHSGNWSVVDGSITRSGKGGSLVCETMMVPDDFELRFQWKVAEGSNSGVYYRPGQYEYQILDNSQHADGKNPRTSAASLYFCMQPSHDATRPVGQWNEGRIVCKGTVVQHWLNGEKVIDFDYADPKYQFHVDMLRQRGGELDRRGAKLSLQDHGDPVWYRDIQIRELSESDKLDRTPVQPATISPEILAAEKKKLDGIVARRQAAKQKN
ncbi:family 16 glycoside hydrolase [Stieleria varia]|nr:family 16 glycoside hydrolase [Stieleria varia]